MNHPHHDRANSLARLDTLCIDTRPTWRHRRRRISGSTSPGSFSPRQAMARMPTIKVAATCTPVCANTRCARSPAASPCPGTRLPGRSFNCAAAGHRQRGPAVHRCPRGTDAPGHRVACRQDAVVGFFREPGRRLPRQRAAAVAGGAVIAMRSFKLSAPGPVAQAHFGFDVAHAATGRPGPPTRTASSRRCCRPRSPPRWAMTPACCTPISPTNSATRSPSVQGRLPARRKKPDWRR